MLTEKHTDVDKITKDSVIYLVHSEHLAENFAWVPS